MVNEVITEYVRRVDFTPRHSEKRDRSNGGRNNFERNRRKREWDHLVQQSPDRKWKKEFRHFRVERYDRGSDPLLIMSFFLIVYVLNYATSKHCLLFVVD